MVLAFMAWYEILLLQMSTTQIPLLRLGCRGNSLQAVSKGSEAIRFPLNDVAAFKNALGFIIAIEEWEQATRVRLNQTNGAYNPANLYYRVPNFNCVDICLDALGNSGLPAPNSKENRRVWFYDQDNFGRKRKTLYNINLSIPNKLLEELNKL